MSWEKIKEFLNNPIVQLLGGAVTSTIITWVITSLAKLPAWQIWLAIVFVITCLVVIMTQIDAWKGRHKKGLTKLSEKELFNTIHQWLTNPIFSVSPMPDDNTRYFGFYITGKGRPDIYVIRSKDEPSIIQVLSPHIVIPVIGQPILDKVQNSLTIEMARLDVQFIYDGHKTPPQISLMQPVPIDDEITIFEFRRSISVIARASILVQATLVKIGVLKRDSPTAPTAHRGGTQN